MLHMSTFLFASSQWLLYLPAPLQNPERVSSMEAARSCRGYREPPWKFQGSALYQFHLVKSEIARALVPKEFRLVEAFGYTLGGFFLASYQDSPAGVFDELVVISGIVWNPPTSCAWASKVLVSSNEACLHGRKQVGLPSHVAKFSKILGLVQSRGITNRMRHKEAKTEVTQLDSPALADIFSINFVNTATENSTRWIGPSVKLSLPSFSGRTEDNPSLLKYSCQMICRVRLVRPLRVAASAAADNKMQHRGSKSLNQMAKQPKTDDTYLSLSVMLSKPILALEFSCMEMNVEAPLTISD